MILNATSGFVMKIFFFGSIGDIGLEEQLNKHKNKRNKIIFCLSLNITHEF